MTVSILAGSVPDPEPARRLAAWDDVTQPAGSVTHRGQTPPIYDNLCQGGHASPTT
jgi:hypothetical protein